MGSLFTAPRESPASSLKLSASVKIIAAPTGPLTRSLAGDQNWYRPSKSLAPARQTACELPIGLSTLEGPLGICASVCSTCSHAPSPAFSDQLAHCCTRRIFPFTRARACLGNCSPCRRHQGYYQSARATARATDLLWASSYPSSPEGWSSPACSLVHPNDYPTHVAVTPPLSIIWILLHPCDITQLEPLWPRGGLTDRDRGTNFVSRTRLAGDTESNHWLGFCLAGHLAPQIFSLLFILTDRAPGPPGSSAIVPTSVYLPLLVLSERSPPSGLGYRESRVLGYIYDFCSNSVTVRRVKGALFPLTIVHRAFTLAVVVFIILVVLFISHCTHLIP